MCLTQKYTYFSETKDNGSLCMYWISRFSHIILANEVFFISFSWSENQTQTIKLNTVQ